MSGSEPARAARMAYSRLVAHILRHLEATTSLPLGGRLSGAPSDPAVPSQRRQPGALSSTHSPAPTASRAAALRSLRSLRASLDDTAGFPDTRTNPTCPPLGARSLASLARSNTREAATSSSESSNAMTERTDPAALRRVTLKTMRARRGGAVSCADAMTVPDGSSCGPGSVVALAPPRLLEPEALRRLVVRATSYAADVPTYGAVHARLRRARGSAVGLPCFRCGRRSTGWACLASDGDRVTGTNSERRRVSYSPDIADYSPACDRCRAATDAEHAAERRAVAGLALSPIRKPKRPVRVVPEPKPEPEPLFGLDATDPTGWSLT